MMEPSDYKGLDVVWLAVDSRDHVAAFATAGEGSIPATALAFVEDAEEMIRALPMISNATLKGGLGDTIDWVVLAERGFFAYDWSDVHRPQHKLMGYELMARPNFPVCFRHLPPNVAAMVRATKIENIAFGTRIIPPTWV